MPRGGVLYFKVEAPFVNSPEYFRLSPEAIKVYLWLCARCIETRKDVIYNYDTKYIGGKTGMSSRKIARVLTELEQTSYGEHQTNVILIKENNILIPGISANNPNFKWLVKTTGESASPRKKAESDILKESKVKESRVTKKDAPIGAQEFISKWMSEWKSRYGTPHKQPTPIDQGIIKSKLKAHGLDTMLELILRWHSEKHWFNEAKDLAAFLRNVDNLIAAKSSGGHDFSGIVEGIYGGNDAEKRNGD